MVLKKFKILITLQGMGILQIELNCNFDSSTPYYHLETHLRPMDTSITNSESTTSLAIIPPFYTIFESNNQIYLKIYYFFSKKDDMPLSLFKSHVFIITKYANIQKIIQYIFTSSAHKITFALVTSW